MSRRLLGVVAGVIVVAGLLGLALMPRKGAPAGGGVAGAGATTIGGPFALVDGHGKNVTDRDFRGRFMLIYFGYTHCPDACPTTLSDISNALDKLPAAIRPHVVPIFITVDPERDTPTMMGDYAAAFGPEFVGLTGNQAAITTAEREYHVYAQKHPLKNGDYAMDHSSIMYVMGPDGGFVGVIADGTKPGEIAAQLRAFGV